MRLQIIVVVLRIPVMIPSIVSGNNNSNNLTIYITNSINTNHIVSYHYSVHHYKSGNSIGFTALAACFLRSSTPPASSATISSTTSAATSSELVLLWTTPSTAAISAESPIATRRNTMDLTISLHPVQSGLSRIMTHYHSTTNTSTNSTAVASSSEEIATPQHQDRIHLSDLLHTLPETFSGILHIDQQYLIGYHAIVPNTALPIARVFPVNVSVQGTASTSPSSSPYLVIVLSYPAQVIVIDLQASRGSSPVSSPDTLEATVHQHILLTSTNVQSSQSSQTVTVVPALFLRDHCDHPLTLPLASSSMSHEDANSWMTAVSATVDTTTDMLVVYLIPQRLIIAVHEGEETVTTGGLADHSHIIRFPLKFI
jgi:hypothetical protein